jgi:hypothetical protein
MSCDPAFRIRTYQLVRLQTLEHVAGAEYPKARLFDAVAPARRASGKKTTRKKKADVASIAQREKSARKKVAAKKSTARRA